MGFGDGFNKQYPGLENSGSTDIKVTGSLLVTGDLTVLGSSNIGGGGGSGGGDAFTGSTNIFRADQIISGNLNIDGTITAKQFNVVTSSVLYTSGSTKFGDDSTDTHQFTGSVITNVGFTGSLNGTASYATNATSALTASYVTTGAVDQFTTGVRNQFSAGSNIGISAGIISLSQSLQGLSAVTASYFTGSSVVASTLSGNIDYSYIQGTIPVNKGGTGQSTFSDNSLLIASGTNAFTSLTGSNATDKYVVAWNATSSNYVLTASVGGLNINPTAEGQTLIASGTNFIAARPIAGSNIGLDFASGSITVKLSSSLDNLTSVSSSWFTGSLKGTAQTASYVNPLTQSVFINGNLSASSGITGSFSGSIASSSMITNFVTDVQNIAAGSGLRAITGSSNISITAGQYPTASLNTNITLENITVNNKITALTGSFQLLETVSASSLMVGDKYIVIMSGATDHTTLSGSGLLWGSGSTGPTVGVLGSNASILYNSVSDVLVPFPGMSGSFTGSFNGNGSGLTNLSAASITGVVKAITGSSPLSASVDGNGNVTITLNSGSVNFNGVTAALGATGSIPLVSAIITGSNNITASSSSLSGAVTVNLNTTLTGLTSVSASQFTGSGANLTNVASSLTYASATPALAVSQVVALSGGLVAADATNRLRANAFGVIQASSSAGYIVQTSNEIAVAFSSSNRSLLVTGSEFYVSSSGTASLYEDITGSAGGRYATQIGYFNRISGSTHYIIISPRPFGLVY